MRDLSGFEGNGRGFYLNRNRRTKIVNRTREAATAMEKRDEQFKKIHESNFYETS
jgi:hypothetical protein